MSGFVARVQALALALGAPGVFLLTLLDSSFLSLPEIADLAILLMVTQHKSRLVLYAGSATLGSIAGCLVMYHLGRKGGDALLRSRFASRGVERASRVFQRYGLMAVLVPAVLPPPAPFKVFVLLAGVARVNQGRFILAIALGRGIRYFGEGLLAVRYGDQAAAFLEDHGRAASLWMAGVLLGGLALYLAWTKARALKAR
jgi:membrane protein YqaA with SNARE-associated domain